MVNAFLRAIRLPMSDTVISSPSQPASTSLFGMESVQRGLLWLMIASGFVVVIEPAPTSDVAGELYWHRVIRPATRPRRDRQHDRLEVEIRHRLL